MRFVLSFIVLIAFAGLASAQHKHPQDVAKINAALPAAKITPAQRAEVVKLRNEGEKLHYEGKHGQAEVVLERAKAILKVR